MKILVKFPSRSRPNKFFDALDNLFSLSTHDNLSVLATLDEDDITMNNDEVKNRLTQYNNVKAHYGRSDNKIHACNKDMEFASDWQILILMSDDMKFLVNGFDSIIVGDMKEYWPDTDGVLHYPDTHGKHELSVLSIMGKKYYDRFNYLYFPGYKTMYCDNEYTQVAQILNRWRFIPTKIYDHYHHIWGMAQKDELNIRNDNMNLYVGDSILFQSRKANNFGIYTL